MTDIDGELQKLLSGWKAGLVLLTCAFPEEHDKMKKLEISLMIYSISARGNCAKAQRGDYYAIY
ncbi:MAG: hypothetical protein K2P48_10455 [Lachnospiraceae bacterium]|nr:hypothetical protein [Lachnospiraceae bacterium]